MTHGWDYVIVGAGSAGAVLAARLSEDPDVQVLLLEAGLDYRSAGTPAQFHTRDVDMDQTANPEYWWPGVAARRNPAQQPYPYMSGRGLGGSSTVNGLCAIRGIPDDYDRWARAGAKGWSYQEVLPAFVRMEDERDFGDADYHGRGGPVPVYREPEPGWGGVDRAFRDAALDGGAGWCDDHNAPDATGVSPFAMNIRDGRRHSTNDGYDHAHAAVPPDLMAALRRAGVRDWSIWRSGRDLFHLVDCDDFAAVQRRLAGDPADQRWQAEMTTYVEGFAATDGTAGMGLRHVWTLTGQAAAEETGR